MVTVAVTSRLVCCTDGLSERLGSALAAALFGVESNRTASEDLRSGSLVSVLMVRTGAGIPTVDGALLVDSVGTMLDFKGAFVSAAGNALLGLTLGAAEAGFDSVDDALAGKTEGLAAGLGTFRAPFAGPGITECFAAVRLVSSILGRGRVNCPILVEGAFTGALGRGRRVLTFDSVRGGGAATAGLGPPLAVGTGSCRFFCALDMVKISAA